MGFAGEGLICAVNVTHVALVTDQGRLSVLTELFCAHSSGLRRWIEIASATASERCFTPFGKYVGILCMSQNAIF